MATKKKAVGGATAFAIGRILSDLDEVAEFIDHLRDTERRGFGGHGESTVIAHRALARMRRRLERMR